MNANDKSLLRQMIKAGRFNYPIYELLVEHNRIKAKEMIDGMGSKWCLHPANSVKRLDVPLPLLSEPRQSKILKGRK